MDLNFESKSFHIDLKTCLQAYAEHVRDRIEIAANLQLEFLLKKGGNGGLTRTIEEANGPRMKVHNIRVHTAQNVNQMGIIV